MWLKLDISKTLMKLQIRKITTFKRITTLFKKKTNFVTYINGKNYGFDK